MNDFILIKRDYDKVPRILCDEVQAFAESEELKVLDAEERKLPSLVCAAFARYFVRLHQPMFRGGLRESEAGALGQCYAVIEKLAASTDPAVQTLVVEEIFETISEADLDRPHIERALMPKSLALFKQWIG